MEPDSLLVIFLKGSKLVRRTATNSLWIARSSVNGRPIRTKSGAEHQVIHGSVWANLWHTSACVRQKSVFIA